MNAIDPNANYTAQDVARIVFRRSTRWFYMNRASLHAIDGFPAPISTKGKALWHGDMLLAWLRRPSRARAIGADTTPAPKKPAASTNVLTFRTAQLRAGKGAS